MSGPSVIAELRTERLDLRAFTVADATAVASMLADGRIAATTARVPYPYSLALAQSWIASHEEAAQAGVEFVYAVSERDSRALVGALSIRPLDSDDHLGWWVGLDYWNRGYCTEAAAAALRHAFLSLELPRVSATHLSRNPASGRVMQKIGLKHEGRRLRPPRPSAEPEWFECYGLLAADYFAASGR